MKSLLSLILLVISCQAQSGPQCIWVKTGAQSLSCVPALNLSPPGMRQAIWYEYPAPQAADGSYQFPGLPLANGTVLTIGPTVFRNGKRQTLGTDYSIDPANAARFIPVTSWAASDTVLVEYWSIVNNGPTLASPSF